MTIGETTHKFVLALNKRIDEETLLKVAARAALGIVNEADPKQRNAMRFLRFLDGDGSEHPFISALSLIVMRGKAGELKKFKMGAVQAGLACVSITRAMVQCDGREMEAAVSNEREPEYLGVMAFGEKPRFDPLTRKMSLWK